MIDKFSPDKLLFLKVVSALVLLLMAIAFLVRPAHTQSAGSSSSLKKPNLSVEFSPASSGVKLLEAILSRLHGSVQVAMAKQERRLGSIGQAQVLASDKAVAGGESEAALNYKLAIKPKAQKELKMADLDSSDTLSLSSGGSYSASSVTSQSTGAAKAKRGQAQYFAAPRQVAILDESVLVKDRRVAKEEVGVSSLPPVPLAPQSNSVDQIAESQDGLKADAKKANSELSNMPSIAHSNLSASVQTSESGVAGKLSSKNLSSPSSAVPTESAFGQYRLAMTPPTIFKGISGTQLGASESDVYRFWMGKGTIQKEAVASWKVFGVRSKDDKYIVQLFLNSGHVEAIRIFDNAYVLKNLGVNIGDSLAKLKQTLGEPSFIISEPGSAGGQNYVYPVNQIAFQLRKGGAGKSPGIVSMLIFNTK